MAKYYETSTVFNYNYEQILQGFWKRYPNPYSTHVLSEDTIQREIRDDGKLYSKRLLTKTNRVPKWGERFFKAKFVCIIEESLVDPKAKTLTTHTRNIGFNKIMVSGGLGATKKIIIVGFCRAWWKKSFTNQTRWAGPSPTDQRGSTRRSLVSRRRSVRSAVKGSRRTARSRWVHGDGLRVDKGCYSESFLNTRKWPCSFVKNWPFLVKEHDFGSNSSSFWFWMSFQKIWLI